MKKITLLLILLTGAIQTFSQDLYITFSGAGKSSVVDSVTATNLATNKSIKVPGNETLILSISTGIEGLNERMERARLFPNPFQHTASLSIDQTKAEDVIISVSNLIGQVIYQSKVYEALLFRSMLA